jgi:peptide/nickel transport system substrate-binding protein
MRRKSTWIATAAVAVLAAAAVIGGKATAGGKSSTGSGGTMTLLAKAAPSGSPDPAIDYTLQEWQLLIMTHDGLIAFKRVAGKAGTEKVPDLAVSIPKPTAGGKTYTFKIRKNIHYANGAVVKPSDFKRTFERMFKVHGPTAGSFYNVFVGADKCLKKPATCSLSRGIVPNDKAYTLTFHLVHADPEFLDKLGVPFAFVLPPGTPDKEVNIPPAGTGPYVFAEYKANKQIRLVRNKQFKEWSKDAQPQGNPDEIVMKFGLTVEAEVTQVENGQADWVFDAPPADRLPELGTKYASQTHVNPLTAVWYFAFNVRQPPFDNVKARQAVNFATDRNALVKIYGGPNLAVPTCQVLPPNFPGYEPYCPYTKSPGAKWSAPDLAKAKKLVEQSGTKGQKVKVTVDTTEVAKSLGLYFVGLLNSLGYKATLQALSPDIQYPFCQNSKNKVQFCWSSWYQDYPAASDFINVLLGCSGYIPNSTASPNIAEFCDEQIEAQIQQALTLGIEDPAAANRLWAKIDRQIVGKAPWVAMFNPKLVDFVSKRVKGYQFNPQWYFLIDQASVQ